MGLHTAAHNLAVAKRENAAILLEADYEKNYDYDPNSPEGHIMLSMYQNAFLEQSILIADKVESQFQNRDNRKSRGVKQAGFVVLKETTMPSILIETGFLTNEEDEDYLFTTEGQDETAHSIFEAFASYKKEVEGGLDLPIATTTPPPTPKKYTPATEVQEQPEVVFNTPPIKQMTKKGISPIPYPVAIKKTKNKPTPAPKSITQNTSPKPQQYTAPKSKTPSVMNTKNVPVVAPIERPDAYDYASNKVIHFKVQMAVSSHTINTNVAPWNQHRYIIEVVKDGQLYKYQATNFGNYERALKAKNDLRRNGFPDAFLVAYQNGKRIPIQEAKRILGL